MPAVPPPPHGNPELHRLAGWRHRLRRLRHRWRLLRSGLPRADGPGFAHKTGFSGADYRAANPDVAASGLDPLLHYLLDGWAQGRPLRRGPHQPPHLPAAAVLGFDERVQGLLRHLRPRRRTLHPQAGPDAAATILLRPRRGAMPTGWCLMSARGLPDGRSATLLVLAGGRTGMIEVPADTQRPALVQLADVPARLALRRADPPGPDAEPRPVIVVRELGRSQGLLLAWRRQGSPGLPIGTELRRLEAAHRPADASSYAAWVRLYDAPSPAQCAAVADRLCRLGRLPRLAIVPSRPATAAERDALAAGLAAQLYPGWELGGDAVARADFVAFVEPDAVLAPLALLLLAEAIAASPEVDLLYGDQDQLVSGTRQNPWFKPDCSPERLAAQDLFGALGVVRANLLDKVSERRPDWPELARGRSVLHLPHVLAHACGRPDPDPPVPACAPDGPWPSVTAIVPTRDQAGLLGTCLAGLLDGTDYPALDILVADNDSREADALDLLDRLRARGVAVLPCPGPFNYAAINNRAAAAAGGAMLLFLNNDVAMPEPGWLKQLVRLAASPGIGAVGAKLLYPDGTLQHGGIVLGMGGVAGHFELGAAADDPGYFDRLRLVQEVSAVTAACMLVPARHFAAVGGFDADNLAVAFNDVDFCLRLRQAGLRILWTPHAVLRHAESKSRGSDFSPARLARFTAEIATMQGRWANQLGRDPFFSPNLSLDTTDIALAFPPRTRRPWE